MILVKNWNFLLWFVFNKIGFEIMFADNPLRKQAYLDWKIRILPSCPMQIFFKGVNPSLWWKIEIFFLCLLLNKIGLKKLFGDHTVRKEANVHWKIRILPSRPMQIFFHFGQKLEFSSLICFQQNRSRNNGCWQSS